MTAPFTCHRTILTARAPLHIGWHDLGTVQRTRYYIPARNLWGAAVAALAPRLHARRGDAPDYRAAQQTVGRCLRFTYFFPLDDAGIPLLPRYAEDGMWYGGLDAARFEARFVTSQTSTALEAASFTKLDGSLHESEYLVSRVGNEPVRYLGFVLLHDGLGWDMVRDSLAEFTVGADRAYGWGRLTAVIDQQPWSQPLFEYYEPQDWPDDDGPRLRLPATGGDQPLPAHLLYSSATAQFVGELEPVSGREWCARQGSGQLLIGARLCWTPGTWVTGKERRFVMEDRGLWRTEDN